MENTQKNTGKIGHWLKNSITARMFMIAFLILVLLIPLSYIQDLISERSKRKEGVVKEISEKWGGEVLFYGPVLKVPYKTFQEKTVTDQNTKKVYTEITESINYAYFFPENLAIDTRIDPEEKYYGIYKTSVFESKMDISGVFTKPDFSEQEISDEHILWDKAKIIIRTSNLKGVNNKLQINFNENHYNFESKYSVKAGHGNSYTPLHTVESSVLLKEDLPLKSGTDFHLSLHIKGSQQISFVPVGKETTAKISSHWKTANFFGEFLPYNENKIHKDGFDARWKVLDINRPFSQQHFNQLPDLNEFAFGVNFMIPVDEYQKSDRSAKYGFLVISLTFLIFFLIQTMSKIGIHPFQYLMIGLALTMFYTLLLSISEHSNFFRAYLVAGSSVVALITVYSHSILKTRKFSAFIFLSLTVLYSFIYVIIQLENYALLVGSIGLFLILATVMFISRKVDWGHS
ncbi:cell envelope integrity protein CreD [Sinomicrobium weinanense]|uniref:Cell envelope integrity protein CreD n=1 Tax=Sinomicrobium weinanense TaxID=2842200 RepID=A0A926Q2C3_9FLAO|nr:cell envelope integrity protein CreD [Sinomicrobium weinanense]MBC9796507.1 cell envelope integrity protein CreD [Sinomicrobium weinanense]MBU3123523.1 cell envelope integrity protein CreD [Sinomicrobium weinanense]